MLDFSQIALPPIQLEKKGLTSHIGQQQMWLLKAVERDQVIRLLDGIGASMIADKIRDCCTKIITAECKGCSKRKTFRNHCDNQWCPCCLDRVRKRKSDAVTWWSHLVSQPKHVVLTCQNQDTITKDWLRRLKKSLSSLRRSAFARQWRGGFYSLEVTNSGNGWHVHFHLLVDADYIDASRLAIEWGKRVGQEFAIVKVKDCRASDYLREVTKYAVKPADLLKWDGYQIADFVIALDKVRMFGVFGSCFGKRQDWIRFIEDTLTDKRACECGCRDFFYYEDANPDILQPNANAPNPQGRNPPKPDNTPILPGLLDYENTTQILGALYR